MSKLLTASGISFRRLHGRMTEKKLNLFEFASRAMAKAGTSATEIMGCEMFNTDSLCMSF